MVKGGKLKMRNLLIVASRDEALVRFYLHGGVHGESPIYFGKDQLINLITLPLEKKKGEIEEGEIKIEAEGKVGQKPERLYFYGKNKKILVVLEGLQDEL